MKKKLFTLLTLLLAVCSGAWADTEWNLANWSTSHTGLTYWASLASSDIPSTSTDSSTPAWSDNSTYKTYTPTGGASGFQYNNAAFTKLNRVFSFNVNANDAISVYFMGGGSGNRSMYLSYNATATDRDTETAFASATANGYTPTILSGTAESEGTVYLWCDANVRVYAIKITQSKTVTSKVLTGIKINGSSWDIAGLTNNAATISTAYDDAPTVQFIYTVNYDSGNPDTGKTENVVTTKSGNNFVAASTVLTTNVTLTFTNVTINPTLFSMTDVTELSGSNASGDPKKINVAGGKDATVVATFNTGCSATVHNGHSDSKEMVSSGSINLNGSGKSYFLANLTKTLAEGDIITSSNTAASTFKISGTSGSATNIQFPYIIPSGSNLIGKNTVYVFKTGTSGTDAQFSSFTISRNEKHHVTYSIGTGTGTTPTQADIPETGVFTLAASTGFTAPTGKVFSCWNDGTNDYDAGASYTMGTEDVTLTAVYETSITASFANGGHGTAPAAQVTTGSVVLSPIKVDWYENGSWVADQDVTVDDAIVTAGTAIAAGKTAIMTMNTTFTAQWTYTGKPYIEGVALPEPATNALNIVTQTLFTPTCKGYIVLNPNDVRGKSGGYWLTARNANKSPFTWTAPAGSVFSSATEETNILILQLERTYAVKFTGTTEFKAMMNTRKNGDSYKVKALLVDYSGETPSRVGDIKEIGFFGNSAPYILTSNAIATFSDLDATHTYAVFFYGYDSSTNAVLYQVAFKDTKVGATIGDYGYATFSCDRDLDFTDVEDITAYKAVSATENTISLTEVTGKVKAGDGLVITGNAGTYTIPTTTGASTIYTNAETINMFGCDGTWEEVGVDVGGTNYVLTVQNEQVVFAPVTNSENKAKLKAGQAALWVKGSEARTLSISFGDEATAIDSAIREVKADSSVYSLSGQRVAKPTKGLYIVNGKKVIIK